MKDKEAKPRHNQDARNKRRAEKKARKEIKAGKDAIVAAKRAFYAKNPNGKFVMPEVIAPVKAHYKAPKKVEEKPIEKLESEEEE